jgi:DNA-binding transcriptional MerR regulator
MTPPPRDAGLLTESQLAEIERRFPQGVTSRQILELFGFFGIPLTEATFRRYVQLGLLPRSRRVGRKGKFKGSQGIYPVGVLRRLNLIRRLMREDFTLEEILRSFRRFKDRIQDLEQAIERLLSDLEHEVRERPLPDERRRAMLKDLGATRRTAHRVVRQLGRMEEALSQAPERREEAAPPGGLRKGDLDEPEER